MEYRIKDMTPEYSSADDTMTSTIPTKRNPSYELGIIIIAKASKRRQMEIVQEEHKSFLWF